MRKWLPLFILALGFALAQTAGPVIEPTTGDGPDAVSKGADQASVNQTVKLILPQATALHLDVTEIVFDLTGMDGDGWPHESDPFANDPTIACVMAQPGGQDETTDLGEDFWNQTQVKPGGTYYQTLAWPNIQPVGFGTVDSYPPIELDEEGELVEGSKGYFVCYKTFVLQIFSNWSYWDLVVERNDTTDQGIEHLYIQGNLCSTFGQTTGLYDLPDGALRHLIPKTMNFGPTGLHTIGDDLPEECTGKSWLDVLVVLAVKVNADKYGTNQADLTYTLFSADAQF